MSPDVTEDANKSGEGAEKSEKRGDAGCDLEKDESRLETRDLVSCAGLNGLQDLRAGPVLVLDDAQEDA